MLNKKDNRNELSDEDILRGVDISDDLIKPKKEIKSESEEGLISNDFVDSSLFVVDEVLESSAPRIAEPVISVRKPMDFAQSEKNNNPAKLELSQNVKEAGEVFKDELSLSSEEDIIEIQADRSDVSNYSRWKIAGLALFVIACGVGGYVFWMNKEKEMVAQSGEINTEAILEVNTETSFSQDVSLSDEIPKASEIEEEKIDFFRMKISVFNASGVAGTAGKIKDLLISAKYENVEAKNYEKDMIGITVFYKAEEYKSGAQEVADILKSNDDKKEIKLSLAEESIDSDVAVVLGK